MSNLFRSTVIKGNRLTDFAQSTATVGIVIPFGHGEFVTDGNVIWAALPPKEHVSRKRQGKGGVKQETYTYTMSYAVAFARGELYGYKWIKRNGKVVYTSDPNAPIDDIAYAQKWLQKTTLYYGRRSQLPDSTIESYEGSGRVSAFRDIGYIVVEDDDVTEGGGAVPTYEACVVATPPEVYLTSKPYAQLFAVAAGTSAGIGGVTLRDLLVEGGLSDETESGAAPTGGSIQFKSTPWFRDETTSGAAPTGGIIKLSPVGQFYDEITSGAAPSGGFLYAPPSGQFYDEITGGAAPTGGFVQWPDVGKVLMTEDGKAILDESGKAIITG